MEVWKDVVGYEGLYEVSNLGRVKSKYNKQRATHRAEHILSQSSCRGYKHVALCKDGKMKSLSVHRIVAFAFLNKPEGKDFVDHINTIKDDNRVENLRWCSELENNNNPITREHRSNSKKGMKNPNFGKDLSDRIDALAKINSRPVKQVNLDGVEIQIFPSAKVAGDATGIEASNINRVCNGKRTTAGGYIWRFV